jgi:hypothetical protein
MALGYEFNEVRRVVQTSGLRYRVVKSEFKICDVVFIVKIEVSMTTSRTSTFLVEAICRV